MQEVILPVAKSLCQKLCSGEAARLIKTLKTASAKSIVLRIFIKKRLSEDLPG